MMESLLQNLDTVLVYLFGVSALVAGGMMIVLRHPMQVAMALISAMVFLGGVYGLLGVHFIAAFQVLIYVGAVMVFMVYVIMLLDVRDPSYTRRFSRLLVLGIAGAVTFVGVLVYGFAHGQHAVGHDHGLVRPPAVRGRLPQRILAALRADVGAAGGRGRRGAGGDPGRQAPWISCSSSSSWRSRCSRWDSSA